MTLDLNTLQSTGKSMIKKSETSSNYASATTCTPMSSPTLVRKAANQPKQPAQKKISSRQDRNETESASRMSVQPYSSNIGAPVATINELNAKLRVSKSQTMSNLQTHESLDQSRRNAEAATYNSGRSAVQRADFLFKAATSSSTTVAMGKSAHAVRMNGNLSAPAPYVARKTEDRRTWFNDSYMHRLGGK